MQMKRRNLVVVVLILSVVGGLGASMIIRLREIARIAVCESRLRSIGQMCRDYHTDFGYFPPGTVANPRLPPDKRLSWLTQIWPYIQSGPSLALDKNQAWDGAKNYPPRVKPFLKGSVLDPERLVGEVPCFVCPENSSRVSASIVPATDYVGIAGVGEKAAELPLRDPSCGCFGYDRIVSLQDIKDGASTTMLAVEVIDGGPWTAGGHATVRGLVAGNRPYLGLDGQFTSLHPEGILFGSQRITNVLFADGSVRRFTVSTSPRVFEALATIAGGEEVSELP